MIGSSAVAATTDGRPSLTGRTVLVADDDRVILHALGDRLQTLGLRVETSSDGLLTLLAVSRRAPDLLILDLNLPDVERFRVVERLTNPKFPPVPVIVLTARSDQAAIDRCQQLGVLWVHKGPNTWAQLEPLIYRIFSETKAKTELPSEGEPKRRGQRVLLVDDDRVVLRMLASGLQGFGMHVIQATSGMQGFWLALKQQPDIVVTDYNMDQGSGHYLLGRIKATPATRHIPVIVYSGMAMDQGHEASINRELRGRGGAAAFLMKPIRPDRLASEIGRHIRLGRVH